MPPLLRCLKQNAHLPRRVLKRGSHRDALRSRSAPIDIHPEVEEALLHNKPVVSLETALVTHGLPYPESLELPLALEANVRSTGSVPATIGIIGGRVKIGLERHELERLANRDQNPAKISRRDIAAAIASRRDGGTTCSTTLIFSALAGIKVFGTGGLGGVHRGGETSFDISADLHELTRCPVGLVSSGVKSILDIKRTLEYLETLGVPVVAYNETRDFPAFFSTTSGYKVPWSTTDPAIAAKILHTQWQLNINNSVIFAVPVPEQYRGVGQQIQEYVAQAVQESERNGMANTGNDVTPWLLNRVRELSNGLSLKSNIALLKNNAVIAGQIAAQYAQIKDSSNIFTQPALPFTHRSRTRPAVFEDLALKAKSPGLNELRSKPANVVIVGCAAIDVIAQGKSKLNPALSSHSTIPGSVSLSLGGVARNIAEAASRAGVSAYPGINSLLVAPIGDDFFGHVLAEHTARRGMRDDGFIPVQACTAVCNMVLDSRGALIGGVSDMDITDNFSSDVIIPQLERHTPEYVVFDGNLKPDAIKSLVDHCHKHKIKAIFEPTSVYKTSRVLPIVAAYINDDTTEAPIAHFTPNILELQEAFGQAESEEYDLMSKAWWWSFIDNLSLDTTFRMDLDHLARRPVNDDDPSAGTLAFLTEQGLAQRAVQLLPFFQHIWVKCGSIGVVAVMHIPAAVAKTSGFAKQKTNITKRCVVAHARNGDIVVLKHFPALKAGSVTNVTGAGDSFVGTLVAGMASEGGRIYDLQGLDSVVNTAQHAAVLSLQSIEAVSPLLSELAQS